MIKTTLKVLPLAVFLAACSFVPTYEQPEVPLEQQWMQVSLMDNQGQPADTLGWREYFRDPQLQQLIAVALEHNHDLRSAALNTELAAAQYRIQRSEQLPTISGSAGATRSRTARDFSVTGEPVYSDTYTANLGFSSFELDFFGRVRALSEAALNSYLQTREARDSAQLAVIESVADAYYTARINRGLMDLSERVLISREKTTELARLQFEVGVINAVTLNGYENAIETARASYYAYQRNYQQALNSLSVLVGLPYTQLELPPAESLNRQFVDLSVPPGIPSTVLQSRPDVREAEYALKAANADIGAARAALYPTISLTGSLGYGSTELHELLQGPSSAWSIGPSLVLPIFNRESLYANVEISEINQKILVEQYQATVQQAFKEVSDALIARETYDRQYIASQRAANAEKEVLRLEKMRFDAGVADGMDLLDAERNSFNAEENVLAVQLELLQNLVRLYTSMGGGLEDYGVSLPSAGASSLNLGVPVTEPNSSQYSSQTQVPAGAVRVAL